MRNSLVTLISLSILLITAGCAHQSLTPTITDTHTYQKKLAQLNHWQLEGKIGVRHANKSDSAALQWKQDGDHFDIFLSGPLGAGATRLAGTAEKILIQNSHEEITSASDPQQLIEKHLGWTLPLEKLPQWVRGYSTSADAHLNNEQFNTDHTLASLEYDGWRVDFVEYQTVGQWLLPEKIILKHEDMQVRIVIKHWDIH